MASAFLLAAGHGTRLGALSDELPKPLMPIGDAPAIDGALLALRQAGLKRVVANAHHLAVHLTRWGAARRVPISVESELLGTAGGIARARTSLIAPVLIWNADIICTAPPIADLLGAAGGGESSLLVERRAKGEGTLGLDLAGRVVRLRGERFGEEACGADYLGIAAIGARALAAMPERGCLVEDHWLPELRAGTPLGTIATTEPWGDFGAPDRYLAQNLAWCAERHLGSFVGQGARIAASVDLKDSVIGAGARVTGEGRVDRVVAWPGAEVVAPLTNAIVTSSGRVLRASPVQGV